MHFLSRANQVLESTRQQRQSGQLERCAEPTQATYFLPCHSFLSLLKRIGLFIYDSKAKTCYPIFVKKILVVAAHPDDECLGAGGSISKLVAGGAKVSVVFLGEGPTSRDSSEKNRAKQQAQKAAEILGFEIVGGMDLPDQRFDIQPQLELAKYISSHVSQLQPEIVFTHHYNDLNLDHRLTCEATLVACRALPGSSVKKVLLWENLSSTEWSSKAAPFTPHVYIDISDHLDSKLEAMKAYETELKSFPHPRSLEGIRHLAGLRGAESGCRAAESFEVHRYLEL